MNKLTDKQIVMLARIIDTEFKLVEIPSYYQNDISKKYNIYITKIKFSKRDVENYFENKIENIFQILKMLVSCESFNYYTLDKDYIVNLIFKCKIVKEISDINLGYDTHSLDNMNFKDMKDHFKELSNNLKTKFEMLETKLSQIYRI